MTTPLLQTKLYIPPPRSELVPRPRLIERLNTGLHRKLTLISAPAGFGKTTLLSEWVAASDRSVAWVSLDKGDNDPARFWAYAVAALQTVQVDIGQTALVTLCSPQPPTIEPMLMNLINEIAILPGHFVLVLDDYHLITSPEVHSALVYLLDHQPRNLHLVIATRADPPLSLSLLRGRGQLTELRQSELSFSVSEVASYVTQVMGLDLPPDDVAVLASRTEGWVTGLQMAALTVQGRDTAGASAFLATLSGRHEHIVDYFADEVLDGQPESVRAFLLRTSILERLSGPLCDAVCGVQTEDTDWESGQQVLDLLREGNLFVVSLDDERRWYRYHHLFADLLRQRLLQSAPVLIPELHRRASQWYEQNGFVEEAIDHALRGDDLDRAALLIERTSEAILMRGELVTLKAWLEVIPQEVIRQRSLLCLYNAAFLLLNGETLTKILPYLQVAATKGIPDAVTPRTVALRALLALWQGHVAGSIELGQQALASLPEQDLFWRGIVTGNLGIAYLNNGANPDRAEQMLQQAANVGERAGNVIAAVIALCNLAKLRVVQGQLGAAKTLYDRALALTVDDRGHHLPIGGIAISGVARLLLEWDELEEAEWLLAASFDWTDKEMPIGIVAADSYLTLARVKASLGKAEAAQTAIEQARTVAAGTGATEFDDWAVAAAQAQLWIAQGQLDAAAEWARHRGLAGDTLDADHSGELYVLYELERLTLAELWMAQNEVSRALDLLAALLARSRALQRMDTAIKALVLIALAHHRLRHPGQALAAVVEALTLAQPGDYIRTFVDRGPPMAGLLCQALAQGVEVDYVQQLLAAFGPDKASPTKHQELVEPLSDRELQVLRLMAAHLSYAEIGEQLYISVNTVRFHTKNIYTKLGVHARQDAVERAKELRVL